MCIDVSLHCSVGCIIVQCNTLDDVFPCLDGDRRRRSVRAFVWISGEPAGTSSTDERNELISKIELVVIEGAASWEICKSLCAGNYCERANLYYRQHVGLLRSTALFILFSLQIVPITLYSLDLNHCVFVYFIISQIVTRLVKEGIRLLGPNGNILVYSCAC